MVLHILLIILKIIGIIIAVILGLLLLLLVTFLLCSGEIPDRCVNARRDKGKQRIRPRDVALAPDTDRCVI